MEFGVRGRPFVPHVSAGCKDAKNVDIPIFDFLNLAINNVCSLYSIHISVLKHNCYIKILKFAVQMSRYESYDFLIFMLLHGLLPVDIKRPPWIIKKTNNIQGGQTFETIGKYNCTFILWFIRHLDQKKLAKVWLQFVIVLAVYAYVYAAKLFTKRNNVYFETKTEYLFSSISHTWSKAI